MINNVYVDNRLLLFSKEKALVEFKISCVKYVNDCIHIANSNQDSYTTIFKNKIYPELEENLRKMYNVMENDDNSNHISISWM